MVFAGRYSIKRRVGATWYGGRLIDRPLITRITRRFALARRGASLARNCHRGVLRGATCNERVDRSGRGAVRVMRRVMRMMRMMRSGGGQNRKLRFIAIFNRR